MTRDDAKVGGGDSRSSGGEGWEDGLKRLRLVVVGVRRWLTSGGCGGVGRRACVAAWEITGAHGSSRKAMATRQNS